MRNKQEESDLAGEIDNWFEIIEQSDTGFLGDMNTHIDMADLGETLAGSWAITLPNGHIYTLKLERIEEE